MRLLITALLLVVLLGCSTAPDMAASVQEEVAHLRADVSGLREEVRRLREVIAALALEENRADDGAAMAYMRQELCMRTVT